MGGSRVFFIHRLTDSWVSANGTREGDNMQRGLMPLKAGEFLRYQADGASGGATPPADTKPEDATGGEQKPDKPQEKMLPESRVKEIVEERLKRDREQRERQVAEAAQAEAVKKLAEEKRFEELVAVKQAEIEALAAKVKEHETAAEKLARYEAVLTARRDAEFGKLPEEISELLAGKDIAAQVEWLTKYGAKVAPKEDAGQPAKRGGGTPSPNKGRAAQVDSASDAIERKRKQLGLS